MSSPSLSTTPSLASPESSAAPEPLADLLKHNDLWRASHLHTGTRTGVPTGYDRLDQALGGAGWPVDGLTELLHAHSGIGELRLLAPALATLSQQSRWLLWVSPPYLPYPMALARTGIDLRRLLIVRPNNAADSLWVMEQALASQSCSLVMAWPGQIHDKQLRRLQVASKTGQCLGIVFRHSQAASRPSPAELRIQLAGTGASPLQDAADLQLHILKRRGGWAGETFTLALQDTLNQITPAFADQPINNPRSPQPALAYVDPSPRRTIPGLSP